MSRKIVEEPSDASKIFGMIPYADPKSFNNEGQNYRLNEKSDVYSVGILMWQISSGYKPFHVEDINYDVSLVLAIINGKREKIIVGTPIEYSNLYQGK